MREVELTRGLVTLVDDADYPRVSCYSWQAHQRGKNPALGYYARGRGPGGKHIFMHRFLLSLLPGQEVDHRDGDGLNNQRYNLKPCTRLQNLWSSQRKREGTTSRFRGVCRYKGIKWAAQIRVNRKAHHLGYFEDELGAARAYNEATICHFGEFAQLNPV